MNGYSLALVMPFVLTVTEISGKSKAKKILNTENWCCKELKMRQSNEKRQRKLTHCLKYRSKLKL